MATAEFAVALPAVVLVLATALGGIQLGIAQVQCVDAARAGARMLARGDDPAVTTAAVTTLAPSRAVIDQRFAGGTVTVTVSARGGWVSARLGLGAVRASATAVVESTDQP